MQEPLTASHCENGPQPVGASLHDRPTARRAAQVPCRQKSVARQSASDQHPPVPRSTQVPVLRGSAGSAVQCRSGEQGTGSEGPQGWPAVLALTQTSFTQARSKKQTG